MDQKNTKKLTILPGCITCGRCEFIAPDVFEVLDVAYVKKQADTGKHVVEIDQAIKECPVQVITYLECDKIDENQK